MRLHSLAFPALIAATGASAAALSTVCTSSYVTDSLPSIVGIDFGSVSAAPVYNYSVASGNSYPSVSGRNFCNISVAYSHTLRNDSVRARFQSETKPSLANATLKVNVYYYLPAPSQWSSRFLATGGGGYSINSGLSGLEGGLVYNAAVGLTDGGFGSLTTVLTDVLIPANGTMDWDLLVNLAYLSIHEMTEIGTGMATNFYTNTSKVVTYYQGCSEGGREGWSQVQRYGTQYDGAVIGAPAFRQAFQQPNHFWPQIQQTVAGYVPNTCEIQKLVNDTIDACDALDGRKDGVIGRTDLCRLHYNASSSIGSTYSCAASSGSSSAGGMGPVGASGGSGATPAQNGSITAKSVAAWNALIDGPYDSKGRHLYVGFQPGNQGASDVAGSYNSTSSTYYASASGLGGQWIDMFLNEIDSEDLSLEGVTADTLRAWILQGYQKYTDTLMTVWPDLEDFQQSGGKVIHYHGEADNSIPTLSSVIYHDQVRKTMFPSHSYEQGIDALGDFYKLFLIPGAGHCSPAADNGPFPQTMIGSIIDWVEHGVAPEKVLNATILQGDLEGTRQDICAFPTRPEWKGNATVQPECVWPDREALAAWYPTLDSIPLSVYGLA
ncbi:hypothetical protein LTS10_007128 [Elasticomyces elasticus]|nr:hypothetical protein LTS10_007128 [Elasticomyces elasticus]